MTYQPSRNRPSAATLAAVVLAGLCVSLGACEKKKKAPPPPPPPPPPAPVIPDPVDIEGVMQSLRPDARVNFPERNAPADADLAEAVILFASDLAKGDQSALQGKLAPESRMILDTLVADGSWAEETGKIEQVRIVQLSPLQELDVDRATVVMAIQTPGEAYPLGWEVRRSGSGWTFKSLTTEDVQTTRASEFDNRSIRLGSTAFRPSAPSAPSDDFGSDSPDDPETAGEPEEKEDDGTIRKQTPGGPIEIPTKGPSGL